MARPNDDYYRACVGSWRSPMDFRITDSSAFWGCPMGWVNRLRVLYVVLWPSWLGRLYLDTTVARVPDADNEVVHTTRVSWFGVAFMNSREIIELDPDGRAFVLRGTRMMWPTFWKRESFVGPGSVDESGTRATYDFTWFRTALKQSTVLDEDDVVVTQVTAWSRGVQRLVRKV